MRYFAAIIMSFSVFVLSHQFVLGRLIPPPSDLVWVQAIQQAKITKAKETASPKLLIVGGSETHFGVSAELLSERLDLPSINMGTHAGLSIKSHSDMIAPVINSGDIILFSLNFNQLFRASDSEFDAIYWRHAEPAYFLTRPLHDWPVLLGADIPKAVLETITYQRARDRARQQAGTVNAWGDETRNKGTVLSTGGRVNKRFEGTIRNFRRNKNDLNSIVWLKDYSSEKGAEFFLFYPGVLYNDQYEKHSYRRSFMALDRQLQALGVKQLNSPSDAFLSMDEMYNTIYHPNHAGRRKITESLAQSLNARSETVD